MKRIRRTMGILLVAAMLVPVLGCTPKEPPVIEDTFDYAALYKTEYTKAFPEEARLTNRASYGYTCKMEQGYNGWSYLYGNNQPMTEKDGKWQGGGAAMDGQTMKPAKDAAAVRSYENKQDGQAVLYGNYRLAEGSKGCAVTIFVNDTQVYSGSLEAGDTEGKYYEISAQLKTGDILYFKAEGEGAEVLWNPVVTFENAQNISLYQLTDYGKQYGDVFPYYDEESGKLYMGYLWSDNARDKYYDALDVSENFLTYKNIPEANNYDIWQSYKENYRLHYLYDVNRFCDRSKYAFGVRDNFLYKDEENDRLLMIAGCYYQFDSVRQTSDLVIYASDDIMGLSWTKAGAVVEAGYDKNLPECPSLMKIGNRWYVFVSVAYVTAHQVGPLQYWTGDENVDCLDVNWQEKDYAFLDGEDLCAARPTQVGDKVYMWGWIPSTYDTMPWAPWAGYLNLPREVIQREDGSLGGRLDPGLSSLLNYGNIFAMENAQVNGNSVSLGTYDRNYVTFRMDMTGSNKAGFVMQQGSQEYQIVVEKENGRSYMKVLSPNDPKHKVNSTIELPQGTDIYDIQITIDGEFVEFFVNGECALTAHTAMNNAPYSAYLYADGQASFMDISINKLIPYGDI